MKAVRLPSGSYRVRVYINREYICSVTAPTEKEALKKALLIEGKNLIDTSITVREAIEDYISMKDNILSPSTMKAYVSMSENRFPTLQPVKLKKLTLPMIQYAVNSEASYVSYKTLKNAYALLCSALRMHHVTLDLDSIDLGEPAKKEIYIPTEEQIIKLYQAVSGTEMEVPILLASQYGLRRSEICGLRAEDIDWQNKTMHIHSGDVFDKDGHLIHKPTPKTLSSNRYMALDDDMLELLKDYSFSLTPEQISGRFKRLLKRHKIGHIRFHDLRHYYASVMLMLGVPNKYASANMGHSGDEMLKRVYQHMMQNKMNEVNRDIFSYYRKLELKTKNVDTFVDTKK